MIYSQKQKYIPYYLFLLGLLINYAPASYAEINLDKNIQEDINSEKERMEVSFSCGEDRISEYLDDGWIILKEYSQEKICTWKSVPATKDCDMEKDKGCKITTPDKLGQEKTYLLEK